MTINESFEAYHSVADACYDPQFFAEERVRSYAVRAKLDENSIAYLCKFLAYADEGILRFMWQFYYFQFCTPEDYSLDPGVMEELTMPERAESTYPGCIRAVVYLLAVDNLIRWTDGKVLNREEIIEGYFDRYRNMVALNRVSHGTSGLCRLSYFLYGYAKPSILRVGRLNFQLTTYKDYCEMYEDDAGNRIFAALPNYTYNQHGLQDKNDFRPVYKKEDNILHAHLFGDKGRLGLQHQIIDTSKLKLVLKPGDKVVTIHIPEGGKMYVDDVKTSISAAYRLFCMYFPPIKAIVCQTWFIDPALRPDVVKEGSNIAAFADLFDIICGTDNDNHSIFEHIFKVKRQPLENLHPGNEFQRRIVERAMNGEKIYWSYGVLKKKYCDKFLKERE